jgi:hypothetical protein
MSPPTPTLRGAGARFPSRRNERGTAELGRFQPARHSKRRRMPNIEIVNIEQQSHTLKQRNTSLFVEWVCVASWAILAVVDWESAHDGDGRLDSLSACEWLMLLAFATPPETET